MAYNHKTHVSGFAIYLPNGNLKIWALMTQLNYEFTLR